jgi:hypothetical protein
LTCQILDQRLLGSSVRLELMLWGIGFSDDSIPIGTVD